jgi:hypothetical protein
LGHFIKNSQNELLVVERTISTLQELQENSVDENESFPLEVDTEMLV